MEKLIRIEFYSRMTANAIHAACSAGAINAATEIDGPEIAATYTDWLAIVRQLEVLAYFDSLVSRTVDTIWKEMKEQEEPVADISDYDVMSAKEANSMNWGAI